MPFRQVKKFSSARKKIGKKKYTQRTLSLLSFQHFAHYVFYLFERRITSQPEMPPYSYIYLSPFHELKETYELSGAHAGADYASFGM